MVLFSEATDSREDVARRFAVGFFGGFLAIVQRKKSG
jgi:hypothetical protein